MSQYFPKPYEPLGGDINVKVDLSNHETKADLASLRAEVDKLDVDEFKSVLTNLSNLKSKVDKLDNDKLAPVPVDLNKLSNVVKNDVVKKSGYNAKIKNIKDKTPDIKNLATKTNKILKILLTLK